MSDTEQSAMPAPARRKGVLLRAAVIGGLFLGSFLFSWFGRVWLVPHNTETEPGAETPPEIIVDRTHGRGEPRLEPAVERLDRADRQYRELNHAGALALYKTLLAESSEPAKGSLHYRIAQCQEALGNWEKALAAYRQAASDETLGHGRAAAQLAQARVLIRLQRHDEARHLLYPLVLNGSAPTASRVVVAAAQHWLALVLSRSAMPETLPGHVAMIATAGSYPMDVGPELAALRPASGAKPGKTAGLSEAIAIPQETPGTEKTVRQASFRSLGAHDLFDIIAKTGGMRVWWTPQAHKAIADRSLGLDVQQWPVAYLVATLADCLGLVCQQEGDQIRLAAVAEASVEARQAFALDLARRSSRAALALGGGSTLAPAVYLHIGNLEAAVGNADAALEWYDRLLREKPASPLAVPASFNRGILFLRHGDYAGARQALFRALDLAPGHELAPLALMHIGRTCLEEGDLKSGLTLLRRGKTIAVGAECQPRLTLTLAAGLLLANEPRAAHEVLLQQRSLFKQETIRAAAALLDAMARHRAARAQGPAKMETADLIAALTQGRDPYLLGPIETYLCCQAYRDLGLWNHVVASCAKALPHTQGPMTAALQVTLGDALVHLNKASEATRLLQQVAEGKDARWAAEARFHLAALDLEGGRASDCATRCAQIWRERPCADVTALMRLWGSAYEQLGEHDKAARCYSGSPPQ